MNNRLDGYKENNKLMESEVTDPKVAQALRDDLIEKLKISIPKAHSFAVIEMGHPQDHGDDKQAQHVTIRTHIDGIDGLLCMLSGARNLQVTALRKLAEVAKSNPCMIGKLMQDIGKIMEAGTNDLNKALDDLG